MRYIEKHIRPGDRVLEIGAGTGRYSHALARQGYAVDAVDQILLIGLWLSPIVPIRRNSPPEYEKKPHFR